MVMDPSVRELSGVISGFNFRDVVPDGAAMNTIKPEDPKNLFTQNNLLDPPIFLPATTATNVHSVPPAGSYLRSDSPEDSEIFSDIALTYISKMLMEEDMAGEAIRGWAPRRADLFEKIDKIGQGTYSNVYKVRDLETGRIVALKKVRFDILETESIKFMAREITLLRRLDHPNVIKLEGLVISRVACSLYLVFEYMEHDLGGLAASADITFSLPEKSCQHMC